MEKDPIIAGTIAGVRHNCHISDARHAGQYSLCVFLLKMRELYRWEQRLPQSYRLPKEDVGQWMTQREQFWDSLEGQDYRPVSVGDRQFEPFAAEAINEALAPHRLVYSSGIGVFGKPLFFIGRLHERRQLEGCTIHISDEELARDLVAPPAMALGRDIFIRRQSLRRFLWEKIEEWQWKKNPATPMGRVLTLATAGLHRGPAELEPAEQEALLDALTEHETLSLVLHEQGEILAGAELGGDWEALLAQLESPKAEFIMRALRDLLADSLVTLPRLLQDAPGAALHFWFANFTGMRRALWPQLLACYEDCIASGNFTALAAEVARGQERWRREALELLGQYRREPGLALAHLETLCDCHNIS